MMVSSQGDDDVEMAEPIDENEIILNHVILPRFLPSKQQCYDAQLKIVDNVLKSALASRSFLPINTVRLCQMFSRIHVGSSNDTLNQVVAEELKSLQDHETFAMFVRHQNCTFIVHKKPQSYILATFHSDLSPHEVYNHDSDIESHYPSNAIEVKDSPMLKSNDLVDQLCTLHLNESAKNSSHDFVSKWLITLLTDPSSKTASTADFPIITKKIRSEIIGDKEVHFQRSGIYLSLKVLLQHSLTMALGEVIGKFLYKIVMLKFLSQVCVPYTDGSRTTFNIELLSQMNAKMARRIEKLQSTRPKNVSAERLRFYNDAIEQSKVVIESVHQRINIQIEQIQQINEKCITKSMKCLDFDEDICHKNLCVLMRYLDDRNSATSNDMDVFECEVNSYRRHFADGWPSIETTVETNDELGNLECRLFWNDFENRVLYSRDLNTKTPDLLRQWTLKYIKYAKKCYTDNQLLNSRMILVCLKIIAKLDFRVCTDSQYYHLLSKHHSSIIPELLDALLLPQRVDMDLAGEIQKYFINRNRNATDPSLIDEKHVSAESFAVKFSKKCKVMKDCLRQIDERDEQNCQNKLAEWNDGRRHCADLRAQLHTMPPCPSFRGRTICSPNNCGRCKITAEIINIKIDVYERLLPDGDNERSAIAFELRIPEAVRCLRDILFTFVNMFSGKSERISIKDWKSQPHVCDFKLTNVNQIVQLGSTVQCKTKQIHVDQPFDDFVSANGSNCTYHADQHVLPPHIEPIKSSPFLAPFKTDGEYSGLQWTLNGTLHAENDVLARQSKCPEMLPLSEYKCFGTLREGHRLQLRKLYAMIACEKLSFEKESVLSLIMQTLWECGIIDGNGDGCPDDANVTKDGTAFDRESHVDFLDHKFCTVMLELLEAYIAQQENNWMHPFKILMAVLITVRIFELNNNLPNNHPMVNQMAMLLNKVRSIVYIWIDRIENVFKEIKVPDEDGDAQLRLKLIHVTIIGCLTFFIHSQHKGFVKIIQNNPMNDNRTAPQQWLHFIITLKNNVQMYTRKDSQLPLNLHTFLRLIERIGIDLETTMKQMILSNPSKIYDLIRMQWPSSVRGQFISMKFHHEFTELLMVDTIEAGVQQQASIDIITGTFLINGLPLSRLPSYILNNDVYRWFFGDAAFAVQPESQDSFSTNKKYNNCIYKFKKVNNEIIITELNDNGVERELIHHSKFRDDFPNLLVKNYCHWWNKHTNCIEFQKKLCDHQHFSKETSIDYCLDLSTKHLVHVKTRRPLVDIKSRSYRELVDQLERLEHPSYMHVLLEEKNIVVVELFRMKLKFKLNYSQTVKMDEEFKLTSNEFSGMHVSAVQNIGTLYGLKHGLVLESMESTNQTKILLIPNGKVRTKYIVGEQHVHVKVQTKTSERNPLFYQYQVDESCQQLKSIDCSHASWFYLAYLHACTSLGEIEPFLGMSGTERALQILQSAFAWSSSPYEPEALDILREIAKLSPIRKRATEHTQHVSWPKNIPPHSAQDSYVFIAKKLFEDSQRLQGLFTKDPTPELNIKTELKFNERDYHRCLQLQPNLRVSDAFIKPKELKTAMADPISTSFSHKTQTISILYHTKQCKLPENPTFLRKFLTTKRKILMGLQNEYEQTISELLYHEDGGDFANKWIDLYENARKGKCSDERFTMALSLLAHQDKELDAILALQAVARHRDEFKNIKPPTITQYEISEGPYKEKKVTTQLKKYFKNKQTTNEHIKETIIDDLLMMIKSAWPCASINFSDPPRFQQNVNDYDYFAANDGINNKLAAWYKRYLLDTFIEKVVKTLQTLNADKDVKLPNYDALAVPVPKNWPKFNIDVTGKVSKALGDARVEELIKQARDIWTFKHTDLKRSAKGWRSEIERVLQPHESQHLIQAGFFPRVVSSLLLPQIIAQNTDERIKALIVVWGLAIAKEQHMARMQRQHGQNADWMPCERPEWLLFEIEQNLMIRRIQFKVAKQMMDPPKHKSTDAKHSVMQLNMGEGKTSVIIPMLAAALANGTQVCQITVLKALFSTNLRQLRQYLGGMLNQRIYTFPCRRDAPIAKHIQPIREIFEECQSHRGVILTQPDYRLSFQLKLYETIKKGDGFISKQYMETYQWINANVRNILDESDAILEPNYQLIYTMGEQDQLDGGEQRWMVIQAVLKRVPFHMKRIHLQWKHAIHRDRVTAPVEYDEDYVSNGHVFGASNVAERNDVFTPCRILDDIFDRLKSALADDFLDGKLDIVFSELNASMKRQLKIILTERDVDQAALDCMQQLLPSENNKIRILSGLLRFEVLKLALTKRWRVNYGVDAKGQRKMAIPFKAKDSPATNSEFGHPDVAICLTQLSYYYSGLSDAQLQQLFMTLESRGNAHGTYEGWLTSKTAEIPQRLIDPSIASYSAINLDDPNQRKNMLFPLLRHNMNAIDYYLANIVYPSEAKVFKRKLMCTTWDLCSDQFEHTVTGFSGTNDTKTILPMPIAQNDLPELENTNENMRQILVSIQDPQNRSYDSLPPNVSGMHIVKKLAEQNVPVLLDAGALMLELTNEEVAIEWLKSVPDTFAAAVYFDAKDMLQTIDRNGIVTELNCSVYRDNLDRCVVYLDDVHTRGTDLKFPADWVACVTLSGDITRDKTVQSCMRMRQLGRNQKICFWASYEADIRLRSVCNLTNADRVTNEHVIKFICNNSREFEATNMSHWTTNALNYAKKMVGHKLFESPDNEDPYALYKLYSLCEDKELVQLTDVYGDKKQQFLRDIAWSKFDALVSDFRENKAIRKFVTDMKEEVYDKLKEQAPEIKQFSRALNEEQQKELEQEQECDEKRQAERLHSIKPAKRSMNDEFLSIVLNGITDADINELQSKKLLYTIPQSLSYTQHHAFWEKNSKAWAEHLFVSCDFKKVIEGKAKNQDEYLRPVMWILQIKHLTKNLHMLILISSYECNDFLPAIRKSKHSTLFMYQPKLSQSHRSLHRDERLRVTGQASMKPIDIDDEAQIAVFAGSMYFDSVAEQRAYCGFLGLIPLPWSQEIKDAYEENEVTLKGFVPSRCRRANKAIANCVEKCKFLSNPVDFVTKLIEARHQSLQNESHVASILERGKLKLDDPERFGPEPGEKMDTDEGEFI